MTAAPSSCVSVSESVSECEHDRRVLKSCVSVSVSDNVTTAS